LPWGGSSAGRASRSQCEGRGFDPLPLHHLPFQGRPRESIFLTLDSKKTEENSHFRAGVGPELSAAVHGFKMVGPFLSSRPIAEIEAAELLSVIRRLEKRGVLDTAHRVRAVCGRVFRYAIATGRAKHDISADLKGV
jgi:hypothetical protein